MGKYTELAKTLPKLEEAPDRQQQINEVKKELPSGSSPRLAELYLKLRNEKSEAEERMSEINLSIDAVKQLIEESYEADEITSLRLKSGKTVSTQVEPVASVADREAYRLWCLEQGMEREMHLHAQTTKSLMRSMLLEKGETPPGVKAFMITRLVLR